MTCINKDAPHGIAIGEIAILCLSSFLVHGRTACGLSSSIAIHQLFTRRINFAAMRRADSSCQMIVRFPTREIDNNFGFPHPLVCSCSVFVT